MSQRERAATIPAFKDLQHNRVVIPGLPRDSYTVLATASSVRIYHAQFGSHEWAYSRLKGTLIFGKNNDDGHRQAQAVNQSTSLDVSKYWFRLLDATSGFLKPVWVFKLPVAGFVYDLDRPFFHAFQGMSRRFGFLFEDDDEASAFYKNVIGEISPRPGTRKNRSLSFTLRAKTPPNDGRRTKGPISPSMISLPTGNSFIHVAHVGLTTSGNIEASKGIDPAWTTVLGGYGLHDQAFSNRSNKFVENKRVDFVGGEGYWIGGRANGSSRRAASANEMFVGSDAKGVSGKSVLKGRRRLPTPSLTMF